jgi:hypothetical protein
VANHGWVRAVAVALLAAVAVVLAPCAGVAGADPVCREGWVLQEAGSGYPWCELLVGGQTWAQVLGGVPDLSSRQSVDGLMITVTRETGGSTVYQEKATYTGVGANENSGSQVPVPSGSEAVCPCAVRYFDYGQDGGGALTEETYPGVGMAEMEVWIAEGPYIGALVPPAAGGTAGTYTGMTAAAQESYLQAVLLGIGMVLLVASYSSIRQGASTS